jgi:hypothetical protein
MSKHLIIASYDGISTHYCGVGTIIRNTIYTLNEIVDSQKLKVSLAHISTDKKGKVFNPVCFQESIDLVKKTGGFLIPLCNGTNGFDESDMWKSFPQWNSTCASLVTSLNIILENDDDNIVMLHDTPFLPFAKFKTQMFDKTVRSFYLPHSSGLNHKFGNDEWRKKRVQIENNSFALIKADNNSHVLATGDSFAEHLKTDYQLTFSKKDYLKNGLFFDQYKKDKTMKYRSNQLKQFKINITDNSKIIFSWGRCSIAKGFKELVEVWKEIETELPNHYLILQIPNNSGEADYFQYLKHQSDIIPRTIVIDDFNPEIWKSILRCENTDIVCIPSLMDPNPHTPIEAKLFCENMNYSIVASERDGIKDTFNDDECFRINPSDKKQFCQTILHASRITAKMRQGMATKNSKSLNHFDYSANLRNFFKNINWFNLG